MKVHAELVTSSAHDDELEGDAKKPEEKMESPAPEPMEQAEAKRETDVSLDAPRVAPQRTTQRERDAMRRVRQAVADLEKFIEKIPNLIDVRGSVRAWLEQHAELTPEDQLSAMLHFTTSWVQLHKKEKKHKVFQILQAVGLTYTDMGSDVYMCIYYASADKPENAMIIGSILVVSFIAQGVVAFLFHQPPGMVIAGLLGLKPVVDSYREATDAQQFPEQTNSNESVLMVTRTIEAVTEAVPQVCFVSPPSAVAPFFRPLCCYERLAVTHEFARSRDARRPSCSSSSC